MGGRGGTETAGGYRGIPRLGKEVPQGEGGVHLKVLLIRNHYYFMEQGPKGIKPFWLVWGYYGKQCTGAGGR